MTNEVHQDTRSLSKKMGVFLLLTTIIILSITIYSTFEKPHSINEVSLHHEISNIHINLPIRIVDFTELKSIELVGMKIKYLFSVARDPTQPKEFNAADEKFAQQIETKVKSSACANKNTRRYLNGKVSLSYFYQDTNNNPIVSYEIPSGYCKQ